LQSETLIFIIKEPEIPTFILTEIRNNPRWSFKKKLPIKEIVNDFFTSIDSMPDWARTMSKFTPVTHFIKVVRLIVLKGSGGELFYLLNFAVVLNG